MTRLYFVIAIFKYIDGEFISCAALLIRNKHDGIGKEILGWAETYSRTPFVIKVASLIVKARARVFNGAAVKM